MEHITHRLNLRNPPLNPLPRLPAPAPAPLPSRRSRLPVPMPLRLLLRRSINLAVDVVALARANTDTLTLRSGVAVVAIPKSLLLMAWCARLVRLGWSRQSGRGVRGRGGGGGGLIGRLVARGAGRLVTGCTGKTR